MTEVENWMDAYGLQAICEAIENKMLERGVLNAYIGANYDLSISVEDASEGGENFFSLLTRIYSDDTIDVSEDFGEDLSDSVQDMLFDLVGNARGADEVENIRNKLCESNVIINDKVVY